MCCLFFELVLYTVYILIIQYHPNQLILWAGWIEKANNSTLPEWRTSNLKNMHHSLTLRNEPHLHHIFFVCGETQNPSELVLIEMNRKGWTWDTPIILLHKNMASTPTSSGFQNLNQALKFPGGPSDKSVNSSCVELATSCLARLVALVIVLVLSSHEGIMSL